MTRLLTRSSKGASLSMSARFLGLLALLVLVSAGCSSSDDSIAPDEDGDVSETVDASAGEDSTGNSIDSGERDNGTDGAGGGNDIATWCAFVGETLASSEFNLNDLFQLTPEQLEQRFRTNAAITTEGLAASTDEIGPWVKVIDEAVQGSLAVGIEENWDIISMSENPVFFDGSTLNSLSIASQEIDFYNGQECGLPTNLSGTNGDAVAEAEQQSSAPEVEEQTLAPEIEPSDAEQDVRSLDDAEPIAEASATSSGTAAAGGLGVSTDLPGGSGSEVIDWFLTQMGVGRQAFPESVWDCIASDIDTAYPQGVEPGPLDVELQALVTESISECGLA